MPNGSDDAVAATGRWDGTDMSHQPSIRIPRLLVAAAVAAVAAAAPAASHAMPAHDGPVGLPASSPAFVHDLGVTSPAGATRSVVVSDLRSPDTQDFAAGYQPTSPKVFAATHTSPQPGSVGDGFDWSSAGIGAAIAFALAAVGTAAFALTTRRRVLLS